MKNNKRTKKALSFKLQIRNGRISAVLVMPKSWLIPLVTLVGALLSPRPLINLIHIFLDFIK